MKTLQIFTTAAIIALTATVLSVGVMSCSQPASSSESEVQSKSNDGIVQIIKERTPEPIKSMEVESVIVLLVAFVLIIIGIISLISNINSNSNDLNAMFRSILWIAVGVLGIGFGIWLNSILQ